MTPATFPSPISLKPEGAAGRLTDQAFLKARRNTLSRHFFDGQKFRFFQDKAGSVTLQARGFSTEIKLPANMASLSGATPVSFLDPTTGWMLVSRTSCAVGFHAPCIRPEQQTTRQELISVSGNSLQTITPLCSTIFPNADRHHTVAGETRRRPTSLHFPSE